MSKISKELADYRAKLDAAGLYDPKQTAELQAIRTKPVSKWTGFSPIASAIRKVSNQAVDRGKVPSPALPRRSSRMDRNERARFARFLEEFRKQTRTRGASGRLNQGALTPAFVEVVKTLAFDFYNLATGRTDPSQETLAERSGFSVSTVRRALRAAARAGVLHWARRAAVFVAGTWRRRSNAYQFGPRTTFLDSKNGLEGSLAPCPVLTETRRNIARAFQVNLLA